MRSVVARGLRGGILALVLTASMHAANLVPRMLLLDGAVVGADIIVVGERGTILRSGDNGRTWESMASPAGATLTGVSFAPEGQQGWVVGHDALILGTTDGGRTWHREWQGENLQDSFLDVLAVDVRNVIAVGAYGLFVTTADGGKTWSRRKITSDDFHLNRISRGPTGTLYLAGEHGTLLRSSDQGGKWTSIAAPYSGSFYGIVPLDRRTLLAHGLRGRVYRSSDDGAMWVPIATGQDVLLAASLRLRSNFVVLAGQARALLISRDYGKSFSPSDEPLLTAVAELIETPDGSILALGEAGATVLPNP